LLESELFGHEKGAFTGATKFKPGKFDMANEGTLFLDEIGDMPLNLQSKILRAIQEKEFYRVGGSNTIKVDVRFIASTNQNLEKLVQEGKFREDLYYRLNVFTLHLPPLRERKEDLPLLVDYFLQNLSKKVEISSVALQMMEIFESSKTLSKARR
jgi:transcriptional regulator with GAF, ATPase, and Fis domain